VAVRATGPAPGPTPLLVARMAEGVYALAALVLAFGMPWPPPSSSMVTAVHWLGTGMLAGMLAWNLRRPNKVVWWVAVLLAAYVLINGIALPFRSVRGPALAFAVVIWTSQLIVAGCLWALRDVRHRDRVR
jgi:hypothetical protein